MDSRDLNRLETKLEKINEIFHEKHTLVAFSGGVDSSLVLYYAKQYSERVLGVLIIGAATPSQEVDNAKRFAEKIDVPLKILNIEIFNFPKITNNHTDRCYHCKKYILETLYNIKSDERIDWMKFDLYVDGTNFSDLSTERPGLKALRESEFRSPLAEVELTKEEIIKLSKKLDLPSKDIPSQACLASRVPFGVPLSGDLLEMIDKSEASIRKLSNNYMSNLRVRIHPLQKGGDYLARIEADPVLMKFITVPENSVKINNVLKEIGFILVTIDLEGFRSGSMHEFL